MKPELADIQQKLIAILRAHEGVLRITTDTPEKFEMTGTKETMQGKQKVSGYYFATVVPKPTDVRLYFFPAYTHPDAYADISASLRKCLKGKSCFHLKQMDASLEKEIKAAVAKGVKLYKQDKLI